MMEGKTLRKADFLTSILLVFFGLWVVYQAFQMPMTATYGGVNSVWYVSPALLPIIIGAALVILGVVLLVHSIRSGGAAAFIEGVRTVELRVSASTQRFLGIILALVTFVYLYIPRVDFFPSILLFLVYFIPAYFYDEMPVLRRLTAMYAAIGVMFVVLFATPVAESLNRVYMFATDIVALLAVVGVCVYARALARGSELNKKRFRIGLIVSLVTPLILTPVFRFALLVPFPREGGIVQLMQLIYYSIR